MSPQRQPVDIPALMEDLPVEDAKNPCGLPGGSSVTQYLEENEQERRRVPFGDLVGLRPLVSLAYFSLGYSVRGC